MEYSVCNANENQIKDFLHDQFYPDLPLDAAFGIDNSLPSSCQGQAPTEPTEDFCLKAVDSQGNIVGVAINKVDPDDDAEPLPPEKKNIKEFMDFIMGAAELKKLPERTIVLAKLSVRRDCRGRGVAKRLVEESVKEARKAGFAAIRICCVNEYTAKIARSLGWREHYRIALKDYPKLSGKEVQLKPVPPHDFVYFYVTDL